MSRSSTLLLLPLLLACQFGDSLEPYYSGAGPKISGLSQDREDGTVGGDTITISGSGFGDDPAMITVVFGPVNAKVVSATDSAIEVVVPRGSIEGGAVDVVIGTAAGQARLNDGYFYDVDGPDVEGFYDDEIAYVTVTNDYLSCLGGLGNPFGSPCDIFAFSGLAGLEGRSEILEFLYPRAHVPFTGSRGGFGGVTDVSWNKWTLESPAHEVNTFDVEDMYSTKRVEVKDFTLRNPALEGLDWCANLPALATYTWPGGGENGEGEPIGRTDVFAGSLLRNAATDDFNVQAIGATQPDIVCEPTAKKYDLSEVKFCQTNDYDTPRTFTYEAEWPVGGYFFSPGYQTKAGQQVPITDAPVEVVLDIPEAGVVGVPLVLPEHAVFRGTSGFALEDLGLNPNDAGDQTMFSLTGWSGSCADSNGDRVTTGDDVAATWEWEPTEVEVPVGGSIKAVRSYVRVATTYFRQGWIGGIGSAFRATITVPDAHNVNEATGRSVLEMPASVLYQFPNAMQDKGDRLSSGPGGGGYVFGDWGDPTRQDYGFIIMTAERVTEYKVASSLGGSVIFAYSTGDVGYLLYAIGPGGYSSWVNPTRSGDACGDCADSDGDGWADLLDPDCGDGGSGAEDNATFGASTCNDGIDNDGNGLIDAEDPENCSSGSDGETNCADGIDNDEDGLTDDVDGECADAGGTESGLDDPDWLCTNGLDDDSDGYADFEDPDCTNGADDEVGFGITQCNDGVDNDGHGDVDSDDLYCKRRGADEDTEKPDMTDQCVNGLDDDGDGYSDANDPDCELSPYAFERYESFDLDDPLVTTCYNGQDDDLDGFADASDVGCVNAAGEPDGFVNDENAALPGFTACGDGSDNDGDGWTDASDPDCSSGGVAEVGYSTSTCNDNLDNDGDTFTDAADTDCTTGSENTEIAP